ncbi:endogenous retrovirus group K member 6 Gag polyprotein-like isoform 1-T2 [Cyanocitta cristata]
MGQNISKEQRDVYTKLKTLIKLHSRSVPNQELKDLLLWVLKNYPQSELITPLRKSLWDSVGMQLFDLATKRDKVAASLLPTCRVLIEIFNEPSTCASITGILTTQQVPAESPPSAVCNIAPERGGEVCPQAGVRESPEAAPDVTEKNMDAMKSNPENLNLRADMQIQDECCTSENEFDLDFQEINRLSPAKIRNSVSSHKERNSGEKPVLTDWNNICYKLIKEGDLAVARKSFLGLPMRYGRAGENPRWKAISHDDIKDLRKAVEDCGLGSPYFKLLLTGFFNHLDLTPFDCRNISSMILTDSQYLLWDWGWRRLLGKLLERYAGGPNAALTLAHLAGDPPHDRPEDQADLARPVLADIKEAARKALLKVKPVGSPQGAYTKIKQGPTESFSSFIDRLTQALERQCGDDVAHPILLQNFAYTNANEECQRTIRALPGLQPSLSDMIEACSKIGTAQHIAMAQADILGERLERAITIQAEVLDKTLTKTLNALTMNNFRVVLQADTDERTCFRCGKPGHVIKNCLEPKETTRAPVRCSRCKKGRHYANRCHSRYDIDGNLLPGNGFASLQHCRMKKQIAAVPQSRLELWRPKPHEQNCQIPPKQP